MDDWLDALSTTMPRGYIAYTTDTLSTFTPAATTATPPPTADPAAPPPPALPGTNPPPSNAFVTFLEVDPLRLNRPPAAAKRGRANAPTATPPAAPEPEVWELGDFDRALDEYFSKLDEQRAEAERRQRERAVLAKLERIREDQGDRARALREEAEGASR